GARDLGCASLAPVGGPHQSQLHLSALQARDHALRLQHRRHARHPPADYLKSLLTGQNLPDDLRQQASGSRFYAQYAPGAPLWLSRPADLPGTDLSWAFEQG